MKSRGRLISKSIATAVFVALLPASPAFAGVTFGSPTFVNQTGLSTFSYSWATWSLDNTKVIAAPKTGYLYQSLDTATTWNRIDSAGFQNWSSVAMNDSGTVIAATVTSGYLYLSTDSGATWVQKTVLGTGNWFAVDVNATGSVIAATKSNTSVVVSTDSGTSWNTYTPGGTTHRGITISATGDKMVSISVNGYAYLSSDYGANWTAATTAGNTDYNNTLAWMSRDGQNVVISKNGTYTFSYTSNFGSTWGTITSNYNPRAFGVFVASDDMTKMWALDPNGNTQYSTNSGSTWTLNSQSAVWKSASINSNGTSWIGISSSNGGGIWTSNSAPASLTYRPIYDGYSMWSRVGTSENGNVIAAASSEGFVHISRDGGTTWSAASTIGRASVWYCLAVSGDGNTIYASATSKYVYRSQDQGQTWSTISGGTLPATLLTVYGCATNYNGSKVAISVYGIGVVGSSDSGATFSTLIPTLYNGVNYYYQAVTMTSDGQKIAATSTGTSSPIFMSSNGGSSWDTSTVTSSYWSDVKTSSDGSVLIAASTSTNNPVITTNWGSSWSYINTVGNAFRYGLTMNGDASLIILGQNIGGGQLYYSTNKGGTFTAASGFQTGSQTTIALSADSSKLVIGTDFYRLAVASVNLVSKVSFASVATLNNQATYRTTVTLTATIATSGGDGKVTFFANGKRIPGCINISSTSLIATCNWKPAIRGAVVVSAYAKPTDTSLQSSTSLPTTISVTNRSGRR